MSEASKIFNNLEQQFNLLKKNIETNPANINSEYIIKMHDQLQQLLNLVLDDNKITIRQSDVKAIEEEESDLNIDETLEVLFIDDNEDVLDMIKAFFMNKNINDYYLNSAVHLKEFLMEHPEINIVVSDIRMPDFTGVDVLNIIKSDSKLSHIKVLLMSAYKDFEALVSAMDQGAFAFIFKPIKFEELIEQLIKAKNAIKFQTDQTHNIIKDINSYNYNSFNIFCDYELNIITVSKYHPLKYHRVLETAKKICDIFQCTKDCDNCPFKKAINEVKFNIYSFAESHVFMFSQIFNDSLYLKLKCRAYDDKYNRFIFTIDDETYERKKQLENFTDERLNAIKRIAAGLAHEINQPLNSISVKIQSHLFDLSNNIKISYDEYIDDYKFMLVEVNKISTLLANIRVLGGKYKNVYFKKINILFVLHNVLEQVKFELENLKIKIFLDAKSDYILFNSNEIHLFQIFFNLLSNSIDSIEEKRVLLGEEFTGYISINIIDKPHEIEILFKDNGIGIKSEDKYKIFDPFFTTKDVNKGSGLGLYILYDIIINDYKGKIIVNSVYKEYVEFNIKLPKL